MSRLPLVLAALAATAVLGVGLGEADSGGSPDESLYVSIARDMAAHGEWLTPTLDGVPSFYKPPLLAWGELAAFRAFGPTVFAARLPVLLFVFGTLLLFAALAGKAWGFRFEPKAALMLGASLGVLRFGRLAMMDLPLTFMLTLAAWAVWRAAKETPSNALVWAGVACGGAALLKGPGASLMVVLLVVGFLALEARAVLWSRPAALAAGAAMLTGLPWFVVMGVLHGRVFIDAFVGRENLGKFETPWTVASELKVMAALLVFALPWTLLAWPRAIEWRQRHPALVLAAVWLGAVLLPVSVSSVKMVHWLLPALPAVVLLAARAGRNGRLLKVTAGGLGVGALGLLLTLRLGLPGLAPAALVGASVALAMAAVACWLDRLAVTAGGVLVAGALVVGVAVPAATPPVPPLSNASSFVSRHVLVETPAGASVAVWRAEELEAAYARGSPVVVPAREVSDGKWPKARELARWRRLSRHLAVADAWAALRAGSADLLYEDLVVVTSRAP